MNSILALRPVKTTEVVAETIKPRLPFKLLSNEILDIIHQILPRLRDRAVTLITLLTYTVGIFASFLSSLQID